MKPHEIEGNQAHQQQVEIVLYLDPGLFWFSGHFAVQPLLPGVAQLDWVMHYATTLLAPGWRFHSIQNANSRRRSCRMRPSRSPCTGRKRARYSPSTISATMAKRDISPAAGKSV
ncbi:hypothetical protein UA70_13815, partial [Raoultella planticola]